MDKVDQDCHSNDADWKLGYQNGSFIDTISRHADCILGIKSTFHLDSSLSPVSCPLPGGQIEHQISRDQNGG